MERVNREIAKAIAIWIQEHMSLDWIAAVAKLQVALNNRVNTRLGNSPANLMLGRRADKRMADDFGKESYEAACAREKAAAAEAVRQMYNAMSDTATEFDVDEDVLEEDHLLAGDNQSLARVQLDTERQTASRGIFTHIYLMEGGSGLFSWPIILDHTG